MVLERLINEFLRGVCCGQYQFFLSLWSWQLPKKNGKQSGHTKLSVYCATYIRTQPKVRYTMNGSVLSLIHLYVGIDNCTELYHNSNNETQALVSSLVSVSLI